MRASGMPRRAVVAAELVLLAVAAAVRAEIKPASMFGDHMVLQRDMPVPVWGKADPGDKVTVSFGGQQQTATTGADGRWMVKLTPLEASAEGRELRIAGDNTVVLEDVLVGEVWICSGQSNMAFGYQRVPELKKLLPDAKTKPIRSFTVTTMGAFTPEDNCVGKWSTDPAGSAVAFGFSYHLQKALDVPVAIVLTCWGSSSIEGWMPLDMAEQLPHFKQIMADFEKKDKARVAELIEQAKASPKGPRCWPGKDNIFMRTRPNILYNAMLHPVVPLACRGLVWYQGEANSNKGKQYGISLPLWVKRLRKQWGRDDFHFMAVMLPGIGRDQWATFREGQMQVLALPHTSVANTIDLGDRKNIHPSDKAPICERLALLARRDVHGETIVAQGPVFAAFQVEGTTGVVTFEHAAGLRTTDGSAPKAFQLAAKQGEWVPAVATIKGNTVVLTAEGVTEPIACRYAFSGFPEPNLVNGADLPAYPFRTDDWGL